MNRDSKPRQASSLMFVCSPTSNRRAAVHDDTFYGGRKHLSAVNLSQRFSFTCLVSRETGHLVFWGFHFYGNGVYQDLVPVPLLEALQCSEERSIRVHRALLYSQQTHIPRSLYRIALRSCLRTRHYCSRRTSGPWKILWRDCF